MLRTYQIDELYGMGYSKEDIHRIDDEHTDREDEAKFMCDEPDHDEGEDE